MSRVFWIALLLVAPRAAISQDSEPPPIPIEGPVRFDFSGMMAPPEVSAAQIEIGGPLRFDFSGTMAPPSMSLEDVEIGGPVRFDFSGTMSPGGSPAPGGPQVASGPSPSPSPSGSTGSVEPHETTPGGPSRPQQPPPPPPTDSTKPGGSQLPPSRQTSLAPPTRTTFAPPASPVRPVSPNPSGGAQVRLDRLEATGSCIKRGELFRVKGSGFGQPGGMLLNVRPVGGRSTIPIQARRWTDSEIVGSLPGHPDVRGDGHSTYQFVLTDRRGTIKAELRSPFSVCQ